MDESNKNIKPPPEIGPYVFPSVLAALGLWCLYDGFLTTNPEMIEYQLFNRIAGTVLFAWAVIDFVRTRKREKKRDTAGEE